MSYIKYNDTQRECYTGIPMVNSNVGSLNGNYVNLRFVLLNCVFSIARHVQKHMRLFNVLESLDNGKPVRESRDCDVPIVARHLYHHAGWAQLMDTEMSGWKPVG
jgi:hypothetical protein